MRMFTNGIGVSLGPAWWGTLRCPPESAGSLARLVPREQGRGTSVTAPRPALRAGGSGGDLDAVPWLHHVHLHARRDGRDRPAELLAGLDAQHLGIVGVVHRHRLRYARHLAGAGRVLGAHRVRPVADAEEAQLGAVALADQLHVAEEVGVATRVHSHPADLQDE